MDGWIHTHKINLTPTSHTRARPSTHTLTRAHTPRTHAHTHSITHTIHTPSRTPTHTPVLDMCDIPYTIIIIIIIIIHRYTENEDIIPENPSDVTELVCLAEQVGVPQLVRKCERRLIEFLASGHDQQENYAPLVAFAAQHNLRRLARHIEVEMSLSATLSAK